MKLYLIQNNNLKPIKTKPFRLEKDIQKLCEKNLKEIFNLDFVSSEFRVKNYRIDTLAFDPQLKAFVIIEYKKNKKFSVVDQGYAYLSIMLNNKADFILEYNTNIKKSLKRGDIDWSQSKIIFISPLFTDYQIGAINFKDLPIELWEIKQYANNTVSFTKIQTQGATESIKTISKRTKDIAKVNREIKTYTKERHLKNVSDVIKELYETLESRILNIGDEITIKPTKWYIGFIARTNFVDIHIQQRGLKVWLNLRKGELKDPIGIERFRI
ncbi:MAG: hypothetical protein B5M53_01565 [Candidatus Cloacimonas sp. 4484_209]|nr:MAG: hypothetical protein B5M53_01565 [Candidatus Cloacimonas sp. 4484_209]